jgi:hypothetical protein
MLTRIFLDRQELDTSYQILLYDDICRYFAREDNAEHAQIQDGILARYGKGVKATTDPLSGKTFESYTKGDFKEALENGQVEKLAMGFGRKIADARGNLFSEPQNRFILSHETADIEDIDKKLGEHRRKGHFKNALVGADIRSNQIGSAAILVRWLGGHLDYQIVLPQHIRAFFADTIMDNGISRSTESMEIEDASVIVIKLATLTAQLNRYLAIVGRSDQDPWGRYVIFRSRVGNYVPFPGAGEIETEYEISGKRANPLSYLAAQNPDLVIPEYPLIPIHGGICSSNILFPVTTSLYENCLEISIAGSHLLGRGQDALTGDLFITATEAAKTNPLPRSLRGVASLLPGQDAKKFNGDGASVTAVSEVLEQLMIHAAASYSVPDYMIVSKDHTFDAASGEALKVKARGLINDRHRRIDQHVTQIDWLFQIEKCFLELFDQSIGQSEITTLRECVQTWDPGPFYVPEDKTQLVNRLNNLKDRGLISSIGYLREYYQLGSDAEAIAVYETIKQQITDFPFLNTQEEKSGNKGLSRFRGQS